MTEPTMRFERGGRGRPLLLLHGLGGSHRSWSTIVGGLQRARETIAVDLPGFGDTPPLAGETSIAALADAVERFIDAEGLSGIDMVGSSMGARLVLELARRGQTGAIVSLDPGGFWNDAEKRIFKTSIGASIQLVRLLQPVMPLITNNPVGRSVLFAQLSAKPAALPPGPVLMEMRDFARARSFDELLGSLAEGPGQLGIAGERERPLVIVWGRQDKVCFPGQADKAMALFPHARLVSFDHCGHFPHWDLPQETIDCILRATAEALASST
jgi:pimeloyl-ACP methyl ester carboxylesterase